MQMPNGWNEVQAVTGEFKNLPAGGYICKIVNAGLMISKTGKEMLQLAIDVADGEYTDYFYNIFKGRKANANGKEVKWPCVYYQLTQGDSMGRFKGLLQNIEESNQGYKWQWGDDCELSLKGKLVGGKFREEEYIGNDGKVHTSIKCMSLLPVDGITEIEPPPKKTVELQQGNGYGGYVGDEEIPF